MHRNSLKTQTVSLLLPLVLVISFTGHLVSQSEPGAEGKATGGEVAETADAAAGTSAVSITDADEHPESYLDFALAGGWLMVPIGLLSVLWLAFFAERLIATRRSLVLPTTFVRSVESLPPAASSAQVAALCDSHPSSAARVVQTAQERLVEVRGMAGAREEIENAVNLTAQKELHSLRRYLQLFAVIAAVAPLFGLLGTVTGMIQAFREVAIEGLGSGQALAPGIYKALVTTAAGLLVAIPTLITYHWFSSRADNYTHELDMLVSEFVDRQQVASRGQNFGGRSSERGAQPPGLESRA